MDIEYEVKFTNVNKDKVRNKLASLGAKLIRGEFLQKRTVFFLPSGHEVEGGWLRVRDEGNKVTMTFKVVKGKNIQDQMETTLVVDDFEKAKRFLTDIGCVAKSYQENKRELWILDGVEITIDEWPFVHPYVEVEGRSENEVKEVSAKLGFKWEKAVIGATHTVTSQQYGIPVKVLDDEIPLIVFSGENPYKKWLS